MHKLTCFMAKIKDIYKEEKMECGVGNREICIWQGKKAEIELILFLTWYLFVSGSWYCQIQTTRLIMFFV